MRKVRAATALVVLLVSASLATTSIAAAQSSGDAPKATDVGITAKEIRIAIIADVDNSIAPGLFQGAVNAVKGAAKYLNSKAGGGGIGGRKLVVDFFDSKLNPTETRNAIIKACSDDFAMVGTTAIFVSNVDDQLGCKDKTGATTGMPDLPAFTTGVPQSCSPITFPVTGTALDCATATQSPQTYRSSKFPALFLTKKFGKLHGLYVYSNDTKDATRSSLVAVNSLVAGGMASDQEVALSGSAPQSAYTTPVARMKQDGSNFGVGISSQLMANLRSEAALQGVSSDVVWDCGPCYSKDIAKNPVYDDTWVESQYLPFEEASANPMLKNFVKYVPNPDAFSVYGWTASIAFAEAARAAVAEGGVNGLTRSSFLKDGIPTLTKFDAGGMTGVTNIADKVPTHCWVMMHLKDGKYTREAPAKKGTFDCNPKNEAIIKADLLGQ